MASHPENFRKDPSQGHASSLLGVTTPLTSPPDLWVPGKWFMFLNLPDPANLRDFTTTQSVHPLFLSQGNEGLGFCFVSLLGTSSPSINILLRESQL